ncbi:MAG: hypothetical protein QF473_09610 [Planctomycetota bacterium]|jgi:hypothetical protein|nr:hypothetical protein [Planctomycetota bacterium]MDP6502325.1 hypothetical protein [Planctomycetota bacterium]
MELDEWRPESRKKREERRKWKKKIKKKRPSKKIRFKELKEGWLWNTVE